MKTEITAALDYLFDKLRHANNCAALMRLTDVQNEDLRRALDATLTQRFTGHWYPEKPLKGSAFRCLQITADEGYVHPILLEAFREVGVTDRDLLQAFGGGVSIWTDPNEVSCQLGGGAIFPVYKRIAPRQAASEEAGPQQQQQEVRPNSTPPDPTSPSYHNMRSNTPPGLSSAEHAGMSAGPGLNPNAKVFSSPVRASMLEPQYPQQYPQHHMMLPTSQRMSPTSQEPNPNSVYPRQYADASDNRIFQTPQRMIPTPEHIMYRHHQQGPNNNLRPRQCAYIGDDQEYHPAMLQSQHQPWKKQAAAELQYDHGYHGHHGHMHHQQPAHHATMHWQSDDHHSRYH